MEDLPEKLRDMIPLIQSAARQIESRGSAIEFLVEKRDTDLLDVLEAAEARIEELEERLKAATDDAKEAEAYAEELEAKLAKAVELANLVVEFSDRALWKVAKEVVLELKGEK